MLIPIIKSLDVIEIKDTTYGKQVVFQNGYALSIIQGCGRNSAGNFEVAVISPYGGLDYTYTRGDSLNYQTPEMIILFAKKIAGLNPELEYKAKRIREIQKQYFLKFRV